MIKNILAIGGILLLLLGLFLFFRVRQASNAASGYDNEWQLGGTEGVGVCTGLLREADVPDRIMSEQESQSLTVLLANDHDTPCNTTVTLAAPNFIVSPPEFNQPITLPPHEKLTITWILSPFRTGTYVISVSTPNEAITFGITVTTVLGLTALQAQLLSLLATALGPMLTVPWWYEQWQKHKEKQATPPLQPTPPPTEPAEPHYLPE